MICFLSTCPYFIELNTVLSWFFLVSLVEVVFLICPWNIFLCPPHEHLPSLISLHTIHLGNLLSSFQTTCPAQQSRALISMISTWFLFPIFKYTYLIINYLPFDVQDGQPAAQITFIRTWVFPAIEKDQDNQQWEFRPFYVFRPQWL